MNVPIDGIWNKEVAPYTIIATPKTIPYHLVTNFNKSDLYDLGNINSNIAGKYDKKVKKPYDK